jgi:hypothetical protein
MSLKLWCPAVLALAGLCAVPARGDFYLLSDAQARAYKVIVPRESEMRWREIPWLVDLDEAVRLAKKEKRPILLWVSGDDPLQRC